MARYNVDINSKLIEDKIKMSGYTKKQLSNRLNASDSYITAALANGSMNGNILRQLAVILNADVRDFIRQEPAEDAAPVIVTDDRTNNLLAALYKRVCSLEKEVHALNEKVENMNFVEPTEEQMLKFVLGKLKGVA